MLQIRTFKNRYAREIAKAGVYKIKLSVVNMYLRCRKILLAPEIIGCIEAAGRKAGGIGRKQADLQKTVSVFVVGKPEFFIHKRKQQFKQPEQRHRRKPADNDKKLVKLRQKLFVKQL